MGVKKNNNYLVVILTLIVLIFATISLIKLSTTNKATICNHEYSEFSEVSAPGIFTVGEKKKNCKKCNYVVCEKINATIDLPQLYLAGNLDGIAKDNECMLQAEYIDSEIQADAYASIKYQGHTSMGYDKKNFTIKFFEDEARNNKYKLSLNGWEKTNKYCLKANYIDFSSARNIVSSRIWQDVVSARKNPDENISELEFLGGIDGYPFALFINNEYQGLYTFNIPKDENTYNIADKENEAMFIINSGFSDAANFRSLLTQEDKDAVYDLEYAYPEDSVWAYERIDELISFVMKNDGKDFVKGIDRYLDVDAAIDYLITAYVLGVSDNFAKNMILLTYDGYKWIPNMYDLDTACGLIFDGTGYLEPDFSLPSVKNDGTVASGTENLLWERILNNYKKEFKKRYTELRSSVLDTDKLIKRYKDFISSVPSECYEYELELYPDTPNKEVNQIKQISDFMKERTKLLDAVVEKL